MKHREQSFSCPTCGADVPRRAKACPECGADEETGWSQDAAYDDLNLPATDADSDEEAEWEATGRRRRTTALLVAIVVAFILVTLLARS